MAQRILRIVFLGLAVAVITEAYQAGAPAGVCVSMTPQHGVDPQTSEFPYSLTTTKKGSQIIITIKTKTPTDSFKGFIIEVRNGTKPIGTFNAPPDTKTIDCAPDAKNALTHNSSKEKKEIKTVWTAPPKFYGTVHVIATVARDGLEFWVGHKSSDIKIEAHRH